MNQKIIKNLFFIGASLAVLVATAGDGACSRKYIDIVLPAAPSAISTVSASDAVVRSWHDAIAANKTFVDNGRAIVRELPMRDLCRQPATLDEARAVIWHLFAHSVATGHGFAEGTWVIYGKKDDIAKMTDFFMSAADPIGFVAVVKNSMVPSMFNKKRRLSSHFKEWKTKHYGIDVKGLPISKKHILFSSPVNIDGSDEQKIYIKIENYGVSTLSDFIHHTKEYVGLEDRRHQYFRKEKLPDSVKQVWVRYAPLVGIRPSDVLRGLKSGISTMKTLLATVPAHLSIPAPLQQALMPYHQHAKGNEVVVELVSKKV